MGQRLDDFRSSAPVRLGLYGPFRLETDAGEIELTSAKAIGLIALLALSPEMRRTRAWLQDKLWSDRGREQAAASLRQTLSVLRRAFDGTGALEIDRKSVTLNPNRIQFIELPGGEMDADLLEGLDIRDPEFEEWLRLERARFNGGAPIRRVSRPSAGHHQSSPAIYCICEKGGQRGEAFLGSIFLDFLSRSVHEFTGFEVSRAHPSDDVRKGLLVRVATLLMDGGTCSLRVEVEDLSGEKVVWAGHRFASTAAVAAFDDLRLLELIFETTEVLAGKILHSLRGREEELASDFLTHLALRKLFTMNSKEILEADAVFDRAFEIKKSATLLAWKSQLRIIQMLERVHSDERILREEISALTSKSLQLEPANSVVLSSASNAMIFLENDFDTGVELARRGLKVNPANPLAWDCLSIALLMRGDFVDAHKFQLVARKLTENSPIRHFWDMGACLTSCVLGKHREARTLAYAASLPAPDFRPPLRYLIALEASDGNLEQARAYEKRLQEIEPDFSIARMIEDADYPVAAMRRGGLLRNDSIRELAGF